MISGNLDHISRSDMSSKIFSIEYLCIVLITATRNLIHLSYRKFNLDQQFSKITLVLHNIK